MPQELLNGWVGAIVGVIGVIWAVLMFFAPFFWYGTNRRTKEISEKMDKLIEITQRQKRD